MLVDKKKKPLSNKHARRLRYASDDKKIATVSKTGKIKAKKKGKCKIYVYARNGYAKKINIKTTKTGAELRIISIEKPTEDAVAAEKNLEDAFLFYFGEKSEEKQDA